MKLKIGDTESIKERDKGRIEAWKLHFEKLLVEIVNCPDDCMNSHTCNGPEVMLLAAEGIKWQCSKQWQTCSHCGQDIERDPFWTDFQGKSSGWVLKPNPFDPEIAEVG
jgi:hypothetical protein